MEPDHIVQRIRDNLIGQYLPIATPFGDRPLVYADYTASGRSLRWLEHEITERVLPYYANTHSESSLCGAQTTALREQARAIVADALGCSSEDRVIFCGSGATAAINRLIDILGLRRPNAEVDYAKRLPDAERPVVFIGPYEHHSNELPWRESIAEVVRIPLDPSGHIDKPALQAALERHHDRRLLMGSFSAASNVTGVITDVHGITQLLKQFGALAFWDYAAAGPYVPIDMNAATAPVDAVFLSPHKFVGGPGTPGVLALKASLAKNPVPAVIGGGTVSWVSAHGHRYLADIERREEGGTPAIVESIRAGLVIGLQQAVGTEEIARREQALLRRAREQLARCRNIEVLGPSGDEARLAILSLRFAHREKTLHYGFVVALLNDLFGIQARGGCSCAGPYGHKLLSIDRARSRAMEAAVRRGVAAMRPGWVRLNLNYFIEEQECDYLIGALSLIGELGWRMLPAYRLDPGSGRWLHRDGELRLPTRLDPLGSDRCATPSSRPTPDFGALLSEARSLLEKGASTEHLRVARQDSNLQTDDEVLRWFTLPADVAGTPDPVPAVCTPAMPASSL